VCVRPLFLTEPTSAPSNQALVPGFRHSCSVLIVLVCVCLYTYACKCVTKVIKINKHKRNRDDITCNMNVEIEIDVHSDVIQAVKSQVFRHDRIQYE